MMTTTVKNWAIGKSPLVLESINNSNINIAIHERETRALDNEIQHLLTQKIELRVTGTIPTILIDIQNCKALNTCPLMSNDIKNLLHTFQKATKAGSFRLLLATINTNMCRKFHTDINDLRMICTYSGPGTLWLTEENINHKALDALGNNDDIVIEEREIQQAKTGAVVILKGAIYPHEETEAIVHRSPTIEESGESRLLLRIDNDECINFE